MTATAKYFTLLKRLFPGRPPRFTDGVVPDETAVSDDERALVRRHLAEAVADDDQLALHLEQLALRFGVTPWRPGLSVPRDLLDAAVAGGLGLLAWPDLLRLGFDPAALRVLRDANAAVPGLPDPSVGRDEEGMAETAERTLGGTDTVASRPAENPVGVPVSVWDAVVGNAMRRELVGADWVALGRLDRAGMIERLALTRRVAERLFGGHATDLPTAYLNPLWPTLADHMRRLFREWAATTPGDTVGGGVAVANDHSLVFPALPDRDEWVRIVDHDTAGRTTRSAYDRAVALRVYLGLARSTIAQATGLTLSAVDDCLQTVAAAGLPVGLG